MISYEFICCKHVGRWKENNTSSSVNVLSIMCVHKEKSVSRKTTRILCELWTSSEHSCFPYTSLLHTNTRHLIIKDETRLQEFYYPTSSVPLTINRHLKGSLQFTGQISWDTYIWTTNIMQFWVVTSYDSDLIKIVSNYQSLDWLYFTAITMPAALIVL